MLPLYGSPEPFVRIRRVADDIIRMESAVSNPSLPKQRCGLLNIMNVPSGDIDSKRQFVLGIAKDVYFVSPSVLFLSATVGLNYPARIGIRDFGLATVRPRLNRSAIDGERLSKVRELLIKVLCQSTHDVLDGKSEGGNSELGAKARKGRLTGDFVGRIDATRSGDVGIVLEDTNEVRDRGEPQIVVGHVAAQKDFGIVSLGATSPWASKLGQEFFIGEFSKDSLKLGNYWWDLSIRREYSNIGGTHWEDTTFLSGRGRRVLAHLAAPSHLRQVY